VTEFGNSIKGIDVDIFSGVDDKRLRKLAIQIHLDSTATSAATAGDIDFSLTFSDLGQPQTISAPANAQPIGNLLQLLQGVAGGSGSGSTSGAGTSTGSIPATPSPPSSGNANAYLQCLQNAKGSAAVQACASKLQ